MKLLYITNGINGSGGLERVLSIKASMLVDQLDYQVHILVLNNTHQNLFYKFSDKIIFHSINVKGNPFNYFIKYRKGIKNVIKIIKPDIISVCDDGLKGMLFPFIFGKKITTIYERHVSKNIEQKSEKLNVFVNFKLKLKHKLMNFAGSKFERFIVLTNGSTKEWNLKNIMIIPNPLPFYSLKGDLNSKTILVVGRQCYQKGYDRLIDIWRIVEKKHPDWRVVVYGKKDDKLGLEKKIKTYNIKNSIMFYPPTTKIQEQYKKASIYLMTSRFEGFGMVLIEAMAHGVPCISFDCPHGPSDIISNDKDGWLIENGNIKNFAEKLTTLITNKELRLKMGAKAYTNVSRYKPENIINIWDNLFNELKSK